LIDVPNLKGIFATLVGYQSGAKAYATHYGIDLKEVRLPTTQDWKGRVKNITINFHIVDAHIDEFAPLFSTTFLQTLSSPTPIELGFRNYDPLIFDASGNAVASYEQLRTSLSTAGAPFAGHDHTFTFPGHTIRTSGCSFPIEGIKIKYSVYVSTEAMRIAGEELAQAIIKDVQTGDYIFVKKTKPVRHLALPDSEIGDV
jgi:hypothetical protein